MRNKNVTGEYPKNNNDDNKSIRSLHSHNNS
jgi:hypothetical protein